MKKVYHVWGKKCSPPHLYLDELYESYDSSKDARDHCCGCWEEDVCKLKKSSKYKITINEVVK